MRSVANHPKKGLKTCLYSGNDDETTFKPLFGVLDYLKTGHYDKKQGGLDCPTTNQRFYRIENGRLIDRTSLFWERSVEK